MVLISTAADAERLVLIVPGTDARLAPTHWSFAQLKFKIATAPIV